MSDFDLDELRKRWPRKTAMNAGWPTRFCKPSSRPNQLVVDSAVANIEDDQKSFVIYGEPQSGKTEMMIALTAKLLDLGSSS